MQTSRSNQKENVEKDVSVEPVQPMKEDESYTVKESMLFEFVERERDLYKELYKKLLKKCLES